MKLRIKKFNGGYAIERKTAAGWVGLEEYETRAEAAAHLPDWQDDVTPESQRKWMLENPIE